MCGLFGAIGNKINPVVIRALAIVNRKRGKDSLGFFDSTGKKIKVASDPIDCLTQNNFGGFLSRKHWFIAGHTRHATRGTVNKRNAHPFRFGHIVGAHNGQVTAPAAYDVDSMYLIDQLHKHSSNYAEAFKGIQGYWGLTWFDGTHFYLQAHDNKLTLARKGNTWYYSSDRDHLSAVLGKCDEWLTLDNGATIRFDAECKMEKLEAFKSAAGRGGFYKSAISTTATKPALRLPAPQCSYGSSYRDGDDYYLRDLPDYGYGRAEHNGGMSQWGQKLPWNEFHDAEGWALDLGYNGFFDYMQSEGTRNEYYAYLDLQNAIEEMEEDEDAYDTWAAAQRDAGKGDEYDDFVKEHQASLFEEEDGIDHIAGYSGDNNEDAKIMDAEYERLQQRDEITNEIINDLL